MGALRILTKWALGTILRVSDLYDRRIVLYSVGINDLLFSISYVMLVYLRISRFCEIFPEQSFAFLAIGFDCHPYLL